MIHIYLPPCGGLYQYWTGVVQALSVHIDRDSIDILIPLLLSLDDIEPTDHVKPDVSDIGFALNILEM